MDIAFEELREECIGEVLAIYNYYILNSTATFHAQVLSLDEMREIVFFENPKYKTYLIKSENDICGYVLLTQFKKREAYDETAEVTIYLKPEYTGKGIGSKALTFIEDVAVRQKFHVLIAGICAENSGSIRLFEKSGYFKCGHFKEVGKKFGKRLDVLYFQKIVS
jgi:phosphinothricin acetyltransferase